MANDQTEHENEAEHADHEHAHGGLLGANTELYFALICGALLAIGFAAEKLTAAIEWVPIGFYIAAFFFGGFFTLREAFASLRGGKFEIDTLMLVAAAGAGRAWCMGGRRAAAVPFQLRPFAGALCDGPCEARDRGAR